MIEKTDVTIIIPTLNAKRNNFARKECLKSLEESDFPMKNVTVVFNGEQDITLDLYGQKTISICP